jgi:putative MFS transporter
VKQYSFGPSLLQFLQFPTIGNGFLEELTYGQYHGDESQQIPKRHDRRRAGAIRGVFLGRRVTQSDFLLVVEPLPVMRAQCNIHDPLHEPPLDARFVVVIRRAIRPNEPVRQMGLRTDDGTPRVNHRFSLFAKEIGMRTQRLGVIGSPARGVLELGQIIRGHRRLGALSGTIVISGDRCSFDGFANVHFGLPVDCRHNVPGEHLFGGRRMAGWIPKPLVSCANNFVLGMTRSIGGEGFVRDVFLDRRDVWAFILGSTAVTLGVFLHLPMYWMGRSNGFRLAGMSMDVGMLSGMLLIVAGIFVAAYGLLPSSAARRAQTAAAISVHAPEDAPLGLAHWRLMLVLVIALVIDVMKPAALGFVMPGMVAEYAVPKQTASLVPFFALIGTVTGSVVWGLIADVYGRKASILLSAVVFVGTSICGAMPSLGWNVAMCFLMGAGAGGMLPVTYALLAETMPSKHRGWALVLVGGLGAAGGYFAASGLAALLVPTFSWRILWLVNLPTGLLLILLGVFIPESAKYLLSRGRIAEAQAVMARFGTRSFALEKGQPDEVEAVAPLHLEDQVPSAQLWTAQLLGKTAALSMAAIAWGLVNFGLLLWLPGTLVEQGYSMDVSSRLLAESALIAFPTVFICALMYSRWSTRKSLLALTGVTLLGLLWVLLLETRLGGSPVFPVALLIVGSNGLLAILLPYASESYPLRIRGRATGWVAGCTKGGGVLAQTLSITGLVPPLGTAALLVIAPTAIALALILRYGTETRGMDLRWLEGRRPRKAFPDSSR